MTAKDYIHSTSIRVRYAETDQMGVAYYANYLIWFEQARTEHFNSLGWSYREAEARGYYLPVVEARCRYKAPAGYDDLLKIESWVESWDKIRITIGYRALLESSGKLLAEGETAHVWTHRDLKVRTIPDDLIPMLPSEARGRAGEGEKSEG